ncbi:MAG: hypothetical protein ABEJ92_03010 [Halobacteriales archaeon]
MSAIGQDQVTAVYVLFLLFFGVSMVLLALWVFCLLSGPEVGACQLGI